MPEDRLPISSSRVSAVDVARHSFTAVRRGYEPEEVRSYLELVARELAAWEQRDEEWRAELAEVEERARHPVIDEASLAQALGQQSAQILRHAHEEAARIVQAAEESAAAVTRQAQLQATETAVRTESAAAERIAEAEIAAGAVHQQAAEELAAVTETARREAEEIRAEARHQGRTMMEQAHEARRRVLGDLAQRRRAVMLQIEQFRAARDQVAGSVVAVRREVDLILSDLSRVDDEARAAAAEVARRGALEPEADLALEGESAVADLGLEPAPEPGPEERSEHTPPGGLEMPSDGVTAPSEEPSVTLEEPPTATEAPEETVDEPSGRPSDETLVGLTPVEPGAEAAWPADEPEGAGQDSVEDLFARLRAGRAPGDPPEAGGPAVADVLPPVSEPGPADDETVLPDAGPSGELDTSQTAEPGPDDVARARRAELLDPVVAKLARRLKRALQDDQNHVLDRLRAGHGGWSPDVLPPEATHRQELASAAAPFIEEALKAGMAFGRQGGRTPRLTGADRHELAELDDSLAGTVVTLLRRRMGDDQTAGDEDATERIGAAYREWRGERIERLVGDYALSAFSLGVLRSAGRGTHVRWVLAGTDGDCADCEDNALSEELEAGVEFPTGHRHPPAHAGCRCLILPTVG